MDYFKARPETNVTSPAQVAVVGDRLFTDIMLANLMGSHGIWVRDGVVEDKGLVSRHAACSQLVYADGHTAVPAPREVAGRISD